MKKASIDRELSGGMLKKEGPSRRVSVLFCFLKLTLRWTWSWEQGMRRDKFRELYGQWEDQAQRPWIKKEASPFVREGTSLEGTRYCGMSAARK